MSTSSLPAAEAGAAARRDAETAAPAVTGRCSAAAAGGGAALPDDGGVRLRLRGFCSACRQVLGMPDYERYLVHAAQRHPDGPLLSRADFCARQIDRRFGAGGMRCC